MNRVLAPHTLVRTADDATLARIRQRKPGRSEGSSGLAFEQLLPTQPGAD